MEVNMMIITVFVSVFVTSASGLAWFSSDAGNNYTLLCDRNGEFRCGCPDDDSTSVMDCSNRGIKVLPNDIKFTDSITDISFSENKLTVITNAMFTLGVRVDRLNLSHNVIDLVGTDAFTSLENLKDIDLSHNAIWSLTEGNFRGLRYLQFLNLAYNKITDFFPEAFKGLTDLRVLILQYNSIIYLERNSFSLMPSLETLDLSSTALASLPDEVFLNNTKLKVLRISANSFVKVPSKALRSAKSLQHLELSENPIEKISSNEFLGVPSLEVLEISHMRKLHTLEKYSFGGLYSLKELHLTDNLRLSKISGLSFKHPKKTSQDGATEDEEDAEDDDERVKPSKVSLRHNALAWIPEDLLDWTQLKELDLQDNPWQCDCHLSWIASNHVSQEAKDRAQCSTPSRVAGRYLSSLAESDYTCSYLTSEATIALSILVVAAFLLALGGVAFLMYRRSLISCRRKGHEPKYSRVVSTKDKVDLEWDHTGEPETKA